MNKRIMIFIGLLFLMVFHQNCAELKTVKGISSSAESNSTDPGATGGETTSGSTTGGSSSDSTNGGTTGGGSTAGGSISGGSTVGGSTSGGGTANIFPASFNFNFRRGDTIVMPLTALMPLPKDMTGEFTVMSIVGPDIYRLRKYLGNSIDIGTKIPVNAKQGDTQITLAINHVATELLREKTTITLSSQSSPDILPQSITLVIEPKDTDIVEARQYPWYGTVTFTRTYDGKFFQSTGPAVNLATLGKLKIAPCYHSHFAQELADGRTYIVRPEYISPLLNLNGGQYVNDRIYFLNGGGGATVAIASNKNSFYFGSAYPRNTQNLIGQHSYPSPVGSIEEVHVSYLNNVNRLFFLTTTGKVHSVNYAAPATTNGPFRFTAPTEINFGGPVLRGVPNLWLGHEVAFITSSNKIYLQSMDSLSPSTRVIDLSSETANIEEVVYASQYLYVRLANGKRYNYILNPNTGVLTRYDSKQNPDHIIYAHSSTIRLLNPLTGSIYTAPTQ